MGEQWRGTGKRGEGTDVEAGPSKKRQEEKDYYDDVAVAFVRSRAQSNPSNQFHEGWEGVLYTVVPVPLLILQPSC